MEKTTPLRDWLKRHGFTQTWLANRMKVKRQTVNNWVRGVRIPEDEYAFQIIEIANGELSLEQLRDPTGVVRARAAQATAMI